MAISRARELHLAARRFRFDPLGFALLAVPFGRAGTKFAGWSGLWDWQYQWILSVAKEVFEKLFGADEEGLIQRKAPVLRSLSSGTGTGKSVRAHQPVIKASGDVVRADSVRVGDRLLGPDGGARTVVSLGRGRAPFYRITPKRGGDPFEVNADHVLTLVGTGERVGGQVVDVTVREWLTWNAKRKHCFKLFRSGPVEFPDAPRAPLPVAPWLLGVLIGDGGLTGGTPNVTTPDPEIVIELRGHAAAMGLRVSVSETHSCACYRLSGAKGAENPLTAALRRLGLAVKSGERFIPAAYRTASVADRRALLAGLLDADGSLDRGCNVFDFISKSEQLADDVAFVARSVGLRATLRPRRCSGFGVTGVYWRVTLSGDVDLIPCRVARKRARPRRQKKDPLRTGFSVAPVGEGDYYGWTLAEDPHYLLGDFTVTHNSSVLLPVMIFWMLACYPQSKVLAVSPSREHLGDKLFANCVAMLHSSPFLHRYFESSVADTTIWVKGHRASRVALFRTAVSKEALSGTHADVMMVVFDDAAGVKDESFVATDGARSDLQVIAIAAGQPTRLDGWFWRVTHGPLAELWNAQVVSLLDMPGADDELRRRKALEHDGEDSTDFRVMVLGLPPVSDARAYIPRTLVEKAMDHELRPLFSPDGVPIVSFRTPVVAGLDLAREGEAHNCMAFTAGIDGATIRPVSMSGAALSPSDRAAWAIQNATQERPPYGAPVVCFYDSTGLDGMFEVELERLGYAHLFVPVSFSAADPKDNWMNMRGALWAGFKQWLNRGGILPHDDALARLISAAKAEVAVGRARARLTITPKDELGRAAGRERLDELDARMLSTLAPPVSAIDPALTEVDLPHLERAERVSWAS